MQAQIAQLTSRERREKRRIFLRDTIALCALSGLVIVLSFTTYALFHSFAAHRHMLEQRWRQRGEAALAAGEPQAAINDLRSALAFASDDRGIEVELAMALAAAGRTQEAQTYFTTLLETEPGSGMINLQLARLAVRQGNTQAAVDRYQAAIDGTWNGDGYRRRREIRIELAQMLIGKNLLPEARDQLLITAGNAPDDHVLQLQVGNLLLTAADPADAMDMFKKAARARQTRLLGLEGEGQAAAGMGRYLQERNFLAAAVSENGFKAQAQPVRTAVHAALSEAESILALYPGENLTPHQSALRIAHDAGLAEARLLACPANATTNTAAVPGDDATPNTQQQLLSGLAAHLQHLNPLKHVGEGPAPQPTPATPPAPAPDNQLTTLTTRWTTLPTGKDLVSQLAADPDLAQSTMQLVYTTERITAQACGAPTGEDALLLRIAKAPDQVEAQQ